MIIAIDGPAGAGKSTVAKILAKRLEFLYLDTGAMYRAITLKALQTGVDIDNHIALEQMAKSTVIDMMKTHDGSPILLLDGRDVSSDIRELRVSSRVSDVAKVREVREVLVMLQRRLGSRKNSVLDGRDIGTHVFPDAEYKFYLDADEKERALRRFKEFKAAGKEATLETIQADVHNRDRIDSTREFAPLKRAADAIYIDTTHMTIDQVVEEIITHLPGLAKGHG